jgi:hypothetical protein
MSTTTAAFAAIPHGGPAIAVFVGSIFFAVIAAVVAMETNRAAVGWAVMSFVASAVVLSAGVDVLVH